ncbi:MAG TPA: DNA primase [Patescibacteria group bacterium]|nr:DNA primase [Patescibacteria group bacterium]
MPDSQVEEVKSKINIVDIIGEHVKLNKSGSNYKGLCPFHQEKSPSFMVSSDLQIYKCFGCGEGGDVFTFLEKYEGMEFPEALKYLADKVGIKLTNQNNFVSSNKDVLYEINNLSAKFYNFLLTSHPVGKVALNYLKEERKINSDSIKTFNIGFAPHKKNYLSDYLIKKKGYKKEDLQKAGVVFISKGGNIYDRFAGRIIFPISDHRGNVIALAGRQIPPADPNTGKYINSPQTEIYNKSSSLYGLNLTKDFIKKENKAIVVEGEIDLISSFQIDIKNIVAIKGSAFTIDQAKFLGRFTKEIVLCLDSDFAGIKASIRGIKILEDEDFEVNVVTLGIYKDPDEAAKANPEFLKEKINKAIPVWDFIIDSVVNEFDKNTASGKAKISKELTPLMANIKNKIVQEHYIHKLARILDSSDEAVTEEVEKVVPESVAPVSESLNQILPKSLTELREENLISLILKVNPEILKNKEILDLVQTPVLKKLIREFTGNPKDLPQELFEKYGELTLKESSDSDSAIKKEINNLYKLLNLDILKKKYKEESDKEKALLYQKQYKDFESGAFERIIH